MFKRYLIALLFFNFVFINLSSLPQAIQNSVESQSLRTEISALNPEISSSRSENLDFIFNNQTLGKTTITIKRSEWNKLCDNYRYFYKNENYVQAESYVYEKDGKTWTMNNVGFRLRGNTSRYVPQGIDNGNKQGQKNAQWSDFYYKYANRPNDDYRQSHFKVDFEEFCQKGEKQKMAGCLKGMALKRLDHSCGREIFCYDMFHKYGIWTAPRASHTRLFINILEDEGGKKVSRVNFGVYEMFEEVNSQSIKARLAGENKSPLAWTSSNGNLWKCTSALTDFSGEEMGVEDVRILFDEKGRPLDIVNKAYELDLKTNKKKLPEAKAQLCSFIEELNALPKLSEDNSATAVNKIKAFYEKWFDVDFFLRTYAVNILFGMDDDYWGNKNNYYLYFDSGKNGSGKVYFIPFDYDNTLGCSISDGGFKQNPLDWGRGENRPLMDRLISLPEYREKFKSYLRQVSAEDSFWNYEKCSSQFAYWAKMVGPYLNSPDLSYEGLGVKEFNDYTWRPSGYSIMQKSNNIFDATRKAIEKNFSGKTLSLQQINNKKTEGIKVKIKFIPENAASREFYIDGLLASVIERDWSQSRASYNFISKNIMDAEWEYPFTKDGKEYQVFVKYYDKDFNLIETSPAIKVKARGGLGELSVSKDIEYSIENNVLTFQKAPLVKVGGLLRSKAPGYYRLDLNKAVDWWWLSGNFLGPECQSLNLKDPKVIPANAGLQKGSQLIFNLYYEIPNEKNPGDKYRLSVINYEESRLKNLCLDE
ncbi:MAG: CotH kinase family protein [Treponema sp.]|nr:CotH kinase family protein [Treponema sp.]